MQSKLFKLIEEFFFEDEQWKKDEKCSKETRIKIEEEHLIIKSLLCITSSLLKDKVMFHIENIDFKIISRDF